MDFSPISNMLRTNSWSNILFIRRILVLIIAQIASVVQSAHNADVILSTMNTIDNKVDQVLEEIRLIRNEQGDTVVR